MHDDIYFIFHASSAINCISNFLNCQSEKWSFVGFITINMYFGHELIVIIFYSILWDAITYPYHSGSGLEAFLRCWPPSSMWVGPLIFMATTGGVWIIPYFQIWGYVLYVEHISCVITNCGQHQWAIPSLFSIAPEALLEENITWKLLLLSLDLFFKILLFQVTFLIFFSTAVFSPYFFLVGLLLQYMALFQSRELKI